MNTIYWVKWVKRYTLVGRTPAMTLYVPYGIERSEGTRWETRHNSCMHRMVCSNLFCLEGYHLCYLSHRLSVFPSLPTYLTSIHLDVRVISTSFPNCSTHPVANASSVKRLLDARARFRMLSVASSDIESAWLKQFAYSDSVLAWKPIHEKIKCYGLIVYSMHVGIV